MFRNDKYAQWLLIRKKTFIAFCIICFGLGFEYSLIFPSLWYYISEVIQTDHDELYYGIALASYPVSSIIGAFTIARYADLTKRTRLVIVILMICEVVGNLVYVLHFSPFFPIFGRFISGFGDVANMVMVAEIARSYQTNEITSKISWTVMFFSIGFAVSPGMNIIFRSFDFHIGPIHIVYGNLPGLFMATCFTIIVALAYSMVADISREFDLKAMYEKTNCGKKERAIDSNDTALTAGTEANVHDSLAMYFEQESASNNNDSESVAKYRDHLSSVRSTNYEYIKLKEIEKKRNVKAEKVKKYEKGKMFDILKSILTTFDLALLLAFGFVSSYTLFGFDTLMALIASKYLKFDVSNTSIIFILDGVLYGLVLFSIKKASARYTDFHIIIFSVVLLLFGLIAVLCLSLHHTNIYFNYVCLSIYILAFATTWSIEEVLTRSLFGKLVPSSCQSYSEGIRRSVSSTAFIISGISTAALFKHLPIISSALIVLTVVLLVIFIFRRKTFISPTPQFYTGAEEDEESLLFEHAHVFL